MYQFKYLDSKTFELAVISASIAGGFHPCIDCHFKKLLSSTIGQVNEVIEPGIMIKLRPVKNIYGQAEKLIEKLSDK